MNGNGTVRRRRVLALAGATALGGLLAACGGEAATVAPTAGAAGVATRVATVAAPTSAGVPTAATSGAMPTAAMSGATVAAMPAMPVAAGGMKSAVVRGEGKPYVLWTGIRFFTNSGIPARLLFEPLLDLDDTLQPAPGLVESWEITSPTVTRYSLRSGLKWSDGMPLTAKDVAFSMRLTFTKELNSQLAADLSTVKGGAEIKAGTADTVSGVRVLNDQTFEIETATPDATVLRTLALRWWAPVPQHIYGSIPPADFLKAPQLLEPKVTSGPFKLDRVEAEKWFEMSANTSYWRGKPKLDKLTYTFGNLGDVVALAGQQQFDYTVIRLPDIAAALAKNPNYTIQTVEYIQPYRMQLNTELPKYADPRVRKALAYALDRDTLCKQVYQGGSTPQYTDFLSNYLDPTAEVYKYDPDQARKLLREANWKASDVLSLERQAPAPGAPVNAIAEAELAAYQQFFGDVGVKLEEHLSPDAATYSDLLAGPKWDTYVNPHRRYDQYGALEMKTYLLSDPVNFARWKNAEADTLVRQALTESNAGRLTEIARKLSVIVARECPYIPIRAEKWAIVSRKRFSGFMPIGEGYYAYTKPYNWDVTG